MDNTLKNYGLSRWVIDIFLMIYETLIINIVVNLINDKA